MSQRVRLAPKLGAVRHAYCQGQLTLREATMLQNHYAPVRRWRQPTRTLYGIPVYTSSSLPRGLVVLHHGKTVWPHQQPWAYLDHGGVTYEDRGDGWGWQPLQGVPPPVTVGQPRTPWDGAYAKTYAGQIGQLRQAVHALWAAVRRALHA